ncbi:hypothetical protein INR49_018164 [Caranx melampygus]|nr:hypothetical protein INR49_018164 [Caranx melampygus]
MIKGSVWSRHQWRHVCVVKRSRQNVNQGIDEESLYCLNDQDIDNLITQVGPRSKFRKRLELLKAEQQLSLYLLCQQRRVEAADSAQVLPSTSGTSNKMRQERESWIFRGSRAAVCHQPVNEDVTKDWDHMQVIMILSKICDLETDKRELVGVFGKTGAGKRSLINAVIGVKNLLPSGGVSACTSVMIKVEANKISTKYEAEIEFITKEEWEDELWPLEHILRDDADQEKIDDDYDDYCAKLTALYGEEWRNMSTKTFMEERHFREIPEFLQCTKKILTCESAKELSAKFVKYTRSDLEEGEGSGIKRWYWPLVKCVTVRVPDNDLLQHVTLVNLPGMEIVTRLVGSCSAVWIVTEINRAASEREAWEILEDACSLMGNGGECQCIYFICTKSDHIEDSDDCQVTAVRDLILKRNEKAKKTVMSEFRKDKKIKKHFSEECFKVFTVSSKEFLKRKYLQRDDTEIPKLQESLQTLNAHHSVTLNYVSGAYGILSLIQGARCREVNEAAGQKSGAGSSFHKTLKYVVQNNGAYKTEKQRQINFNDKLSSFLTGSIDEEFRKTFPNERECGAFNGAIAAFTLDTERLIQKYSEVELQLTFLQTEEEKIRRILDRMIWKQKKKLYRSLTEKIEKHMQGCYERAATFSGPGVLKNMRDTIEWHVYDSKNIMFEQAKDVFLLHLNILKECVLKELEETLMKSIELSLKTADDSIPGGEYFKNIYIVLISQNLINEQNVHIYFIYRFYLLYFLIRCFSRA